MGADSERAAHGGADSERAARLARGVRAGDRATLATQAVRAGQGGTLCAGQGGTLCARGGGLRVRRRAVRTGNQAQEGGAEVVPLGAAVVRVGPGPVVDAVLDEEEEREREGRLQRRKHHLRRPTGLSDDRQRETRRRQRIANQRERRLQRRKHRRGAAHGRPGLRGSLEDGARPRLPRLH
jgi:hypothetical protein